MDLYAIRNKLINGQSIYDLDLRVTYYTRVSTSSTDQLNSLKSQIEYFNDFIKKAPKWILIQGYIDEGITGTSVDKRDAFNKMIRDGKDKKFDLIITKEVSRFARNTIDSLFYTRELLKFGVGVFFQNDNINTLMPDSELRLTIMSSMAQEESRKISDRVKWGHKRSIEAGRVLGNSAIWGYNKDNGKLVINEEEAKIVREIFELYCLGYGVRTVAEKLLEKGHKNRNGNKFNMTSLKGILTNPKYKGYYCGKKTQVVDYLTKERVDFNADDWVTYKDYENVPPIVSEETWELANKILKERSEKMSSDDKTSYQNKYLYSGKIICMEHNTAYWRNVYKYDTVGEKEVWQCKTYRTGGKKACSSPILYKHELDHTVKSLLNEIFDNKQSFVNKLTNIYAEFLDEMNYDKEIKELSVKIENIKKRKDKLLDLNIDGNISDDEFKNRNEEFNLQIAEMEKQSEKYNELNSTKYSVEEQVNFIKKSIEEKMDFKVASEKVIEKLLNKVEVYKTDTENIVNLNIILKPNIEIPAILIKSKDLNLISSTHMIRADIETEVSPIVGTERQSEELVNYLLKEFETEPSKIWESNIFGKSLHELVNEGLHNKLSRMPEDAQGKLQETLQKIINEGSGGLICIIL